MNRTLAALFLVTLNVLAAAQTKQDKSIPFFDIVQADGSHFRVTNLVQGQPVMIVYFDPDCEHCVDFIAELLKQSGKFSNTEVVFVTYVPLRRLKSYIAESGLDKYPQFKVGTEGNKYTVRYHYDVIQFPYVALHDRTGKLFATFESEVPSPDELSRMLKDK